ncbi:hypothetical protein [Actinomadura sp. HBU206391]|nr:hypothetical protein [Actinomadura sp. HBU206391]MBC6460696.1 hypothetical protein [Actinomadura sp. HBU206391]
MAFPSSARADNPIVQTIYTADPATLTNASLNVETAAGTDGLYLDDTSFQ